MAKRIQTGCQANSSAKRRGEPLSIQHTVLTLHLVPVLKTSYMGLAGWRQQALLYGLQPVHRPTADSVHRA